MSLEKQELEQTVGRAVRLSSELLRVSDFEMFQSKNLRIVSSRLGETMRRLSYDAAAQMDHNHFFRKDAILQGLLVGNGLSYRILEHTDTYDRYMTDLNTTLGHMRSAIEDDDLLYWSVVSSLGGSFEQSYKRRGSYLFELPFDSNTFGRDVYAENLYSNSIGFVATAATVRLEHYLSEKNSH